MIETRRLQTLLARCEYGECVRRGRAFLQKHPNDSTVLYHLALAYDQWAVSGKKSKQVRRKYQREATEYLRKALRLFPTDARLQHTKGLLLLHMGQPKRALRYLKRAHVLSKKKPGYLLSIANAYRRLGKLRLAIRYYHRAQRLGTNPLLIKHNLAHSFLGIGKTLLAGRYAEEGLLFLNRKRVTPFEKILRDDLKALIKKL